MESKQRLLEPQLVQTGRADQFSRKVFCDGMRDGVPIALGYFAVSFSLGIAARKAGFTPFQGFLVSLLNNASAGEYAAFALIMANATYFEVAVITLIANARYLLMSCALAQRFAPETPSGIGCSSAMMSRTNCSALLSPARQPESVLYLWRYPAGGTGLGFRYGAGHYCGQSAAAAGGQRPECGAVRNVFGYHHPAGSQRPDRCGAGRHQLCAELSVQLSAGHLGTLRGYPHHSFNGGDLRRSSGAVPGQAGGKRR